MIYDSMPGDNYKSSKTFSDLVPGTVFRIEVSPEGKIDFSCTNKGVFRIHPDILCEEISKHPEFAVQAIYPEDLVTISERLKDPEIYLQGLDVEFRMRSSKGLLWYWINAIPHKTPDGKMLWKGLLYNITSSKEFGNTLEQILADISHIIREPVTTMLSITSLIEEEEIDEHSLRTYAKWIKRVSQELEAHTKNLDEAYSLRLKEFIAKHTEPFQDS